MMINCGDPTQPIDPTAIIDDMEAPDFMTVRASGRRLVVGRRRRASDDAGASITPNGDAAAETIPGGRCGSSYAMHVTGQGFSSMGGAERVDGMGTGRRRAPRDCCPTTTPSGPA